MADEFVKVTAADYYGKYDSVGGAFQKEPIDRFAVKHGSQIRVRWPNGRITKERLLIRTGRDSQQVDMNNIPDTFDTRTFVVGRNIHGRVVDVPLRGLRIAQVRRPRG